MSVKEDSQIINKQLYINDYADKLLYKFSLLLIFFLAVLSIFPPLRSLPYFNQLWATCLFGWLIVSMFDSPKYIFHPSTYNLSVYIFVIYTIMIAYITNTPAIGNRFFELAQIPMFYLAYKKNKLAGSNKDNLMIITGLTPFVLFTCYMSINKLLMNPLAARSSGNPGAAKGIELLEQGIGGYYFVYFIVILFAILLFVFFNKNNLLPLKYKIIGKAILILLAINIILSNYTTALLLTIIVVLVRIFGSPILGKYSFFYLFGFVLLYIFSAFMIEEILNVIIKLMAGSPTATRILEIEKFLFNSEIGESSGARLNVFNESIQAFFQNPIFGILLNKSSVNTVGTLQGLGNHSQILDTFALYGLGLGILQLLIYLYPILARIKNVNGSFSILSITILILICILFSINTATPSIGFAVFFIFPTAYDWIQKNNINNTFQNYV